MLSPDAVMPQPRSRSGARKPRSSSATSSTTRRSFYGESLFDDYEQWLVETVRAAIANPRLNWIVKVHPVNVWRSRMDGAALVQLEAEVSAASISARCPAHVKLMAADTPREHLLAVRCRRLRLDGARHHRDGAALLRHSGGDRGHRPLFGPGLHHRSDDAPAISRRCLGTCRTCRSSTQDAVQQGALALSTARSIFGRCRCARSFSTSSVRRPGVPPRADVFLKRRADDGLCSKPKTSAG